MANIETYLAKILSATYGEEVRGSIHDAIDAMNIESENAMSYAATAKESAVNSANAAAASASSAEDSASSAASANTSALSAKEDAESAKLTAESYKNNAQTYMNNAQTYMNNAKASETNTANLERSVGEQVEDVVRMRENFVKFHSLEDPLLDSNGNVIQDSSLNEIRGRVIFADAGDITAVNQYIANLEGLLNDLKHTMETNTANLEGLLNDFKHTMETHAIFDSTFNG